MSDQIIDIIDVGIPGETGDVTPEVLQVLADTEDVRDQAITARNESRAARDDSETWRDQAEVFSATSVELQDAAVETLVEDEDSAARLALDNLYTPLPALAVNPLTGWVHLDGAGFGRPENTPLENANILNDAFAVAGTAGKVYLSDAFMYKEIPVQTGVVTVSTWQAALIGSLVRSTYNPLIKGVGEGWIIHAKSAGFNVQGVNFRGDGEIPASDGQVYSPTVSGILFDRSTDTWEETLGNIDGKVRDCSFMFMRDAVKVVGRNLDVNDNLFSWVLRGVVIDEYVDSHCRGFNIRANRFHNVGGHPTHDPLGYPVMAIDVLSNKAHGIVVCDNHIDSFSQDFYRGPYGRSMFNNNLAYYQVGTMFTFIDNFGGANYGWEVCNNVMFSSLPSDPSAPLLFPKVSDHFITAGILTSGIISGNSIFGTRKEAIKASNGNSLVVVGNRIVSPNAYSAVDGAIYDAIQLIGHRNVISSNEVHSDRAGYPYRYGVNVGVGQYQTFVGNSISEATAPYNIESNTSNMRTDVQGDGGDIEAWRVEGGARQFGLQFFKRAGAALKRKFGAVEIETLSDDPDFAKGSVVITVLDNGTLREGFRVKWDQGVDVDGGVTYTPIASSEVPANTLFVDTDNVLKFKNSVGTVTAVI